MRYTIRHIRKLAIFASVMICASCGDSYIPGVLENKKHEMKTREDVDTTEVVGIIIDLSDTVFEDETEELYFYSTDWDESDIGVDL